ncbi:DUF3866 family protein [Inediibacterium massiliense]|uniref:DUF3866 family protein n=1 Tax=Inediibacterium massiliense TaxID=1658111 RepID=UPI000A6888CA|nr:DUF3866 family protein [Inediibacterium massiliense]
MIQSAFFNIRKEGKKLIGIKIGKVIQILKENENKTEVLVKIKDKEYKAINYNRLTGKIDLEDELILNTTALDLSLGTGGYHFVIANLSHPTKDLSEGGHIMKLRYSPYQLKVFASEEQDSEDHDIFNQFESLEGMPVIVGTLHSMLPAIVEVLKTLKEDIKITYIMTDGAALPIDLSNMVTNLKENKIIHKAITIGNAFGGDLDCVNIYNGLIAAKEITKCHIAVVTMGPGIVGTGTKFGFTGVEQGNIIDAVNDLGGIPIAVPRMSFADQRKRHQGISHHTLTVLNTIAKTKAIVGLPKLEKEKSEYIKDQLKHTTILSKHKIVYEDCEEIYSILKHSNLNMRTMGRSFEEEKEYFITCGLCAKIALKILDDPQSNFLE